MVEVDNLIITIKRLRAEGAKLQDIAAQMSIAPQYLSNLLKGRQAVPDHIRERFEKIYASTGFEVNETDTPYTVKRGGYEDHATMHGDDMEPLIKGGDEIYLRRLDPHGAIPWGHTFLVHTKDYDIVRRIYPGQDGAHIVLRAANADYPDMVLELDAITALHLVVSRLDRKFI